MLVQCLAVDKPASLIISTTRALLGLIAENPTAVADQIDSLVPRLVVLGKDGGTMVEFCVLCSFARRVICSPFHFLFTRRFVKSPFSVLAS